MNAVLKSGSIAEIAIVVDQATTSRSFSSHMSCLHMCSGDDMNGIMGHFLTKVLAPFADFTASGLATRKSAAWTANSVKKSHR